MANPERQATILGEFWDPTTTAARIPGLLEGLDVDRPRLNLLGKLPDTPEGWDDERYYPVLCGVERGGATELTLINCWNEFAIGNTQDVWCQRCLTGAALGPEQLRFTDAVVNMSHLEEWAGGLVERTTVPSPTGRFDVVATAQCNGIIVGLEAGETVSVDARGRHPSRFCQLHIRFNDAVPLEFIDRYLRNLLYMVTFLTATPNYFHRVSLIAPSADRPIEMSGRSMLYKLGTTADVRHWSRMLLSSNAHRFSFPDFVSRWFRLLERLGRSIDFIFSPYYEEHAAIERQFVTAAQALEALHEQLAEPDTGRAARATELANAVQMPGRPPSDLRRARNAVRRMLSHPTLEERLREVIDSLGPFSSRFTRKPQRFAARAANLRNYYTHWSAPRAKVTHPSVDELFSFAERLRLLFEGFTLVNLGFNPDEVNYLMANRPAVSNAIERSRSFS